MTKLSLLAWTTIAIVVLTTLAVSNSPVIDSALANEEEESDRITVIAPRITRERVRRAPGSLAYVEMVESSAMVDYSDLDLGRTADMFVLEQRIREAATRVCEELTEMYPRGQPTTEVCIRRAIEDSMADARLLAGTD